MVGDDVVDVDDSVLLTDHQLGDLLRVPGKGHHGRVKRDAVQVVALQRVPEHHGVVVTAAHKLKFEKLPPS